MSNFERVQLQTSLGTILTCEVQSSKLRSPESEWWRCMYMYRYFQTVDALPDTSGPLSASLSPAAIKDANDRGSEKCLHVSRSQEPNLRPSSRQRSVSTPHCTATRQLSDMFQNSWGKQRMRNLKMRNFILKATRSFMRKFAPTKISRYMVLNLLHFN